jgi:GTP-binding protein
MKNPYQQARFWLSATKLVHLPPDEGFEVAFAGRSNSGKSSAINAIANQRTLARTSKTPGRTQQLVFFRLDDEHRLVDLPGYGYAKVSGATKEQWQAMVEGFLNTRQCLRGLILTMDVRHPLREFDHQLLTWCAHANMPVHVLLSKSDKVKKGAATNTLHKVKQALDEYDSPFSVQLFSALKKTGVENARSILNKWLNVEQ